MGWFDNSGRWKADAVRPELSKESKPLPEVSYESMGYPPYLINYKTEFDTDRTLNCVHADAMALDYIFIPSENDGKIMLSLAKEETAVTCSFSLEQAEKFHEDFEDLLRKIRDRTLPPGDTR